MSSAALRKLTIAHLRGAVEQVELEFKKGSKLTLIYGENGTGKSTICDALDFLSKGKVGSLDNRGLGKTTRYWNTITKSPADIAVTLTADDGACHGRLRKSEVVVEPSEARPRVEVLRRGQILALLEATPGIRYNAISRFIDVAGIEASEHALHTLIRELNESQNTAATRISENIDTIEQFWTTAGRPGDSALSWAESEVRRAVLPVDPELELLRALQSAYARLQEHPAQLAALTEALQQAERATADALHHVNTRLRAATSDSADLIGLLRTARTFLHQHAEHTVCPLCERPAAAASLAERLEVRLSSFAAVQQAQEQQDRAEAHVHRLSHQYDLLMGQVARDVGQFTQLSERASAIVDLPLPLQPPPTEVDDLQAWLTATAELPDR